MKPCENYTCRHNVFNERILYKRRNQNSKISRDIGNCMLNLKDSYTLEEIGELWGLSRERVRQIQDVALEKLSLRSDIFKKFIDDYE